MKKILFLLGIMGSFSMNAQENLEDLLASGIADAQRFATGYISPAAEAMIYNTSNGWVQSAEVKSFLKFDIALVVNGTFVDDSQKTFILNTSEYNNLQFSDGSTTKEVATAFGENDPDISVFAEVKNGPFTQQVEFNLPQGLASANLNILPAAFLQARLGILKATELKVRYFPKIEQQDVEVGIFGLGIQHEVTQWLPAEKVFPIAVSGFVGYNNLSGNYDFTESEIIDGDNQQFDVKQNSWIFQLQASTKWPIFNLYGGLGYVTGTSNFDVLGTYRVRAGIPLLETTSEFNNPFSVKTKVSGVRGSLGASLQLGFVGLHADYNFAEYDNASVGLHFGI
ncbi:DUF6588 family protein [Aequorivita echinoideorum]|uniref:MetA-pathway of phenol degradation n=1 Tax=Aequorivita echinoideorum TaxID=1549647 RepID=A0ABS5S2Y7_9FLAO|nr:DUF6588 family protein [Aequorivita echinoideorum]MBT0607338.1 hypothetical protein [Aequorivita echinoideorum]